MPDLVIQILFVVFIAVQLTFFFFLILPFLNTLFSSLTKDKIKRNDSLPEKDFALIITAYKNLKISIPLVESLLASNYSNYHIYLIADNCPAESIPIRSEKLSVLFPDNPLNSKVNSIKYGISNFVRNHDHIAIFDPDNLSPPDFLKVVNSYVSKGFDAVQGRRVAKNLNSVYACLDAIGEMYYNYIVREATYRLGSSAVIAGSAMSVESGLFREIFADESFNADKRLIIAEDKLLQYEIVKRNKRIAFARDAVVYDEKVDTGKEVQKQKTRWLNSYFKHLNLGTDLIKRGIAKLNFNQFYFGLNIAIPPLIVINGVSFIFMIVNLFVDKVYSLVWLTGFFLFAVSLFIVLLINKADRKIWMAFLGLPIFLYKQFLAILNLKQSDKDFLVTERKKIVSINEVMKNKN